MKSRQLMFQVSANLSKPEAVSFAKTLKPDEKYYLVKVSENPKVRRIDKRTRFVVVRHPRKGKTVKGGYARFVNRTELLSI